MFQRAFLLEEESAFDLAQCATELTLSVVIHTVRHPDVSKFAKPRMTEPVSLAPEAQLYLVHMIEVKWRLRTIDRVQAAKKPRTFSQDTDNEFMWLQIRKILELVTYSAIASDLKRYAALRTQEKGRVEHDQKANKILPRLAGINPRFMPFPMGNVLVQADGLKSIGNDVEESQKTTLDQLTSIFNEASDHLHVSNPFQTKASHRDEERRSNSLARIREVHMFLNRLLWSHYKFGLEYAPGDDPKALGEADRVYLIQFGKADDGSVQLMSAIGT